jgi:hypothetical protein
VRTEPNDWVAPQAYDGSNSHAKFYIYPVRAARFRFGNRLTSQSTETPFNGLGIWAERRIYEQLL